MHGVYNRQNVSRAAASGTVSSACISAVLPNSTESDETTLSFAINPEISEVQILQSAKPSGMKIGAIKPAIAARILS